MIIFLIKWYSVLALLALAIILFRDDREEILYDLKGISGVKWYDTLFNFFLVYIILPLTIPNSVLRIINKWIK